MTRLCTIMLETSWILAYDRDWEYEWLRIDSSESTINS